MPRISVVLCTYNGEKYLEQQLESIINQSIKPDELIIADDASSDHTCEIIEKYLQHFKFIQFYKNANNLGFQKNFQQALLKASGDFIAISDQDDIWAPTKLEILLASFDENTLLAYSDSLFIDENGKITGTSMSDEKSMIEGRNPLAFIRYNCVSGHALMIRNELLSEVLPFPEHIFYDRWFAFVASMHGKLKFVDAPLVLHRRHSASSGKVWAHKQKILQAKQQMLASFSQYALNKSPETTESLSMLLIAENSGWLKRRYLRLKFGILYGKQYFAIKKFSKLRLLYRIVKCKDY